MKKLLILFGFIIIASTSAFAFHATHQAKNTTGEAVVFKRYQYYATSDVHYYAWAWRRGSVAYESTYVIINNNIAVWAQQAGEFNQIRGKIKNQGILLVNVALYAPFIGDWSYVYLNW